MGSWILGSAIGTEALRPTSSPAPRKTLQFLASIRKLEVGLDMFTASVCFVVSYFTLTHILDVPAPSALHPHLASSAFLFSCLVIILLDRSGAYCTGGGLLGVRETACVIETASLTMLLLLLPSTLLFGRRSGILFVVTVIPLLTCLLVIEKHLVRSVLGASRRRGIGSQRVLIYGSGESSKAIYSALLRSPKLGLNPVAIIDDGSGVEGSHIHESSYRRTHPMVSLTAVVHAELIKSLRADVVIVASRPNSRELTQSLIDETERAGASIVFAAEQLALQSGSMDYIELDGQFLYGLHKIGLRRGPVLASRGIDLLIAGLLVVLTSPVLLLICALIHLDSKGPVLFRQRRIGKDGESFMIFKFRSMHLAACGDLASPSVSGDPRITRVGRWLRKTSLDELPQLFNILRGEMALVGPRPEMAFIVAQYTEQQKLRLSVKPGLTGLWQMSADRSRPIHENLEYDFYYLRNRTVCMDLAILFHTLVFAMRGI